MGVKEKAEAWRKVVDGESAPDGPFDIFDTIAQRECELLQRGGTGLPDVISADRYGIEARSLLRRELDDIGDEPHRGPGRKNVLLLGDVFLENVVLKRTG